MSKQYKSVLYKQLRDAGVPITKHYREWSVDELKGTLAQHGHTPCQTPRKPPPRRRAATGRNHPRRPTSATRSLLLPRQRVSRSRSARQ